MNENIYCPYCDQICSSSEELTGDDDLMAIVPEDDSDPFEDEFAKLQFEIEEENAHICPCMHHLQQHITLSAV